jgi:hypothetical protein
MFIYVHKETIYEKPSCGNFQYLIMWYDTEILVTATDNYIGFNYIYIIIYVVIGRDKINDRIRLWFSKSYCGSSSWTSLRKACELWLLINLQALLIENFDICSFSLQASWVIFVFSVGSEYIHRKSLTWIEKKILFMSDMKIRKHVSLFIPSTTRLLQWVRSSRSFSLKSFPA